MITVKVISDYGFSGVTTHNWRVKRGTPPRYASAESRCPAASNKSLSAPEYKVPQGLHVKSLVEAKAQHKLCKNFWMHFSTHFMSASAIATSTGLPLPPQWRKPAKESLWGVVQLSGQLECRLRNYTPIQVRQKGKLGHSTGTGFHKVCNLIKGIRSMEE